MLLIFGFSKNSHAYPQFQISTDNARCSLCHVSPSGGGLLNAYGRSESADTISFKGKGNGDWLYGLYKEPKWLKLGADFRYAALSRNQADSTETTTFLMQSDIYAQFKFGKKFSLYLNIGPRAQARSIEIDSPFTRTTSREHYIMYKPKSKGMVYRLGRFMMPFGIRSQDHTLFIRRDLGLTAFQETYNFSAAKIENDWEAHGTLFWSVPFFLQTGSSTINQGAALYFEKRIFDEKKTAYALQTRIGQSDDARQWVVGGVLKHYSEKARTLFLAETDLVFEDLRDNGPSRTRLVGYYGASVTPIQGLMMTGSYQYSNMNLAAEDTSRHGLSFDLQIFPWAKWELHAISRIEFNGDSSRRTKLGFLQLHYYL